MRVNAILNELAVETKSGPELIRQAAMLSYPGLTRANAAMEADLADQYKRDVRLELLIQRTQGGFYGQKAVC